MRSANSNTQISGRHRCMFFALLLLFAASVRPAKAANEEPDCPTVDTKDECTVIKESEADVDRTTNKITTAQTCLERRWTTPPSEQARACWAMMFFLSKNTNTIDALTEWQQIQIKKFQIDLSPESLWNMCHQLKCKEDRQWILSKLKDTCLWKSAQQCKDIEREVAAVSKTSKRLPPLRKGLGGLSVGLGVTSIVLGVLHLSFPVFKSFGDDCSANGLRVPCVAGRYELGGALIGVGVVIGAVGGGLSLGLPRD